MPADRNSSFRIDAYVSARLRQRRIEPTIQERLAEASGVSVQQIRKYEGAVTLEINHAEAAP